jgi:hypothetical protein
MHTIFASQDAAYPHICSGNKPETYADTPAGVCAHKAAEAAQQFVPLELAPIVVSVLQDFAIRNLLLVLLVAVLYVITAQAA